MTTEAMLVSHEAYLVKRRIPGRIDVTRPIPFPHNGLP